MVKRRHVRLFVCAAALSLVCAADARAQSDSGESAYITGGALAEVKRFSGNPSKPVLDGNAAGAMLAVGTHVGSHWDLQFGVDTTGYTRTENPRNVTLMKKVYTLTSVTENQALSVSTLLRYRAEPHGRWRLGYLGGLSFIRLHRRFHNFAPAATPAGLIPRPNQTVDYSAAPTIGLDARFALTSHLSIVPAIHACVFRFGEESGFLLRPRIGLRWTF